MDIGVIKTPTVRNLLVERIAEMIIKGELMPGDRLPTERELAARTKVSKSAVHLAMADLERMGFVVTNQRHGTYVADFAKTGNIETLNMIIRISGESFGGRRIQDILEMRMALEGKAIELLAQRNDCDLSELKNILAEAEAYVQSERVIPNQLAKIFFRFHHQVCVSSGNFILPLLFNSFDYVTLTFWERAIRSLGASVCTELLHGMYDTLEQRDPEASKQYLLKEFEQFLNTERSE